MSRIKIFYMSVLCMLLFAGCSNTKATYDPSVQLAIDTKLIEEFIAKNNINAIKHAKGFFYEIQAPGAGVAVVNSSTVVVNYEGKLLNGTSFDKNTGGPASFRLNGVIPGWQLGLPLIQKGGRIRLILPSYFAYANTSPGGGIPENAVLDFTIELVDVQ